MDATAHTVTWQITATQTTTVANQLLVGATVSLTNTGTMPAPVGNVVVNLQTSTTASGVSTWTTVSSDVADASSSDGATTAKIDPVASSEHLASFTENVVSGSLSFMDASSNTAFSLVPERAIAPGATVNLLVTAHFDNTVLQLATGAAVRAEVIVSFGNENLSKPSAPNVDINGNGTIDADEAWVRSVPSGWGSRCQRRKRQRGRSRSAMRRRTSRRLAR